MSCIGLFVSQMIVLFSDSSLLDYYGILFNTFPKNPQKPFSLYHLESETKVIFQLKLVKLTCF